MKTSSFFLALAVAGLTLLGCGGLSGGTSESKLRVIHASPDAPNVDVVVGGTVAFTNVPYFAEGVSTVKAGTTQIQVRPTGTSTNVINASPALTTGNLTTVLAVNNVASIEPLVVADPDFGPGPGQARLRLVHASPSTGNVDIYITSPTATLPATPTLANVPFKGVSDALTVSAGSYRVRITPAGVPGTVAIDTGSIALPSNSATIAVALDKAGGGSPLTARTYTASY
ncbi:MAG: DUF4397 domain-containing protein [Armatimonadota bacterium]